MVKFAEGWENPKLWWPDAPQQYEVVTTISLGGHVIDTRGTKFGFREWNWDHAQFTLNGVPYHGHADCYDVGTPEEIVAQWKKHGQNTVRFCGTMKMASEGYRWAGLGAAHFWMSDSTGGVNNSWQPVAVLCRQWNWTLAAGSKAARTLKVLNDTRFADPIDVAWQVQT